MLHQSLEIPDRQQTVKELLDSSKAARFSVVVS